MLTPTPKVSDSKGAKTASKTTKDSSVKESSSLSVAGQLAKDLKTYLQRFKNPAYGIRFLAKECSLNPKTLKRLLKEENKPTYQTLIKLYSVFHSTQSYEQLQMKLPAQVREFLEKYAPEKAISDEKKTSLLFELLQKDPIYIELFVRAGVAPLVMRDLSLDYGRFGMEAAMVLERENIFIRLPENRFGLSPTVTNLDGDVLRILGLYFMRKYSRAREVMGENAISFYAEGLNDEGMKQWLAIDSHAFYQKLQIANDPKFKGSIPVFTVSATDTMTKEKK